MLHDQVVVERLVVVLNRTQVDVPVQVTVALPVLTVGPFRLLFDGFHVLRQQPDQVELEPLLARKGVALVEQRHLEQSRTSVGDIEGAFGFDGHL